MFATPQPARTEDWAPAFRLIFSHLSPEEREQRCANALHLIQQGELDPQSIFVLRGEMGLCGAIVCLPVPGGSALVWPPAAVGPLRDTIEDALVHHATAWLRQRGVKLAQTLLVSDEVALAASLERNGFTAITRLWYMRHDLNVPVHCLDTPARLDYQPFDDGAVFRHTLTRTYENTHDCPEINDVRTIDEVLEGHRAQGVFDPTRWWLALDAGRPVGVLILTEMPENGDWEVAYMGVTPEARRRGFGREILLKALCEARAADAPAVTLSVDARNQPAWNLYRHVGFEPLDQRTVYLAVWR
ncbi:MAG TPA: GNAT family N-acetyltransferase [Gemmataceae bacterium]|nr:GNAT family N-acetyltransferase [Gemmataceae bacterium]